MLLALILLGAVVVGEPSANIDVPNKVKQGASITIKCSWSGFGQVADVLSSESCDLNCQRINLIEVKITKQTTLIYKSSVNGANGYHGWNVQDASSGTAIISKVAELEDTSQYTCIVTDDGEGFKMPQSDLLVTVIPSVPIIIAPKDKKLIIDEAGEIICVSAVASPPPAYTWFKTDPVSGQTLKLPADARTNDNFKESSFTITDNKISFLKVNQIDEGEYFCVAKNEVGEAQGQPEFVSVGSVSVASVVGIVFAIIFGVACIGVIAYIVIKKVTGDDSDSYADENEVFDDGANDVQIGEAYAPYDHKSSRQDFSHVV